MSENSRLPEIAIVGMGCLFPDAPTPEALWQHVLHVHSTVKDVPKGRWHLTPEQAMATGVQADRVYSQKGCFIHPDTININHDLLQVDPKLLEKLDPLFHVLLHAAGAAVADSGDYDSWQHQRAGVIIGNLVLPTESTSALSRAYILQQDVPPYATESTNLYAAGMPAGLLAQALQLGGTSFTLDAACASSLYALKLAMDELQSGRADVMLTGGVSRPDALYTQMGFSQLHALSKKGKSSPFDAQGDGLVVGEGSGIFVLKRLADAQQAGNRIYGVIRGVGLSNDLAGKLLAPSSEGQLRAMRAAYSQAGWVASDVDLIECHATGTPLGDAVEFASLQSLWADRHDALAECVLGSVKSNIGHTLTAAGSAAMIKVLKAMQHKTLAPTVNFQQAAPSLNMQNSPFHVLQTAQAWETAQTTRKAAISAFGFGGINAHVLIEEYIPQPHTQPIPSLNSSTTQQPSIAVVGMAAQMGEATHVEDLSRYLFDAATPVLRSARTWGKQATEKGCFIEKVSLTQGKFRIPPKEMEDMLPQQLLMLQLASQAWDDADLSNIQAEKTAVYIGLGLDINSTNFHLRWALEAEKAQTQKDDVSPALDANRTMGSLGSVVASRIARELSCGGPSFTLSSEGASGMHALATAMHALQRGDIDTAIVGAVDMQGDMRVLQHRQTTGLAAEGGMALVLRRADTQEAYALLEEVHTRQATFSPIHPDAEVMPNFQRCWGHLGAADGLAQVYAAILCLQQRRLPANVQREQAQYWLHNRLQGARQAWVQHQSVEGSHASVCLSEANVRKGVMPDLAEEALCLLSDVTAEGMLQQLEQLQHRVQQDINLKTLVYDAFQCMRDAPVRVALVARSKDELQQQLRLLSQHIKEKPKQGIGHPHADLAHICARDRVFYQAFAERQGDMAFVFPGSGNHFHAMGRDIFLRWPQLLARQEVQTQTLATQFQDHYFWHQPHHEENQTACILGHVSLGIALSDALQYTGLQPKAAIPHSLGETVAFFSLGVWHERDSMLQRMLHTTLFSHALHSEGEAARRCWHLPPSEKVDWAVCVVDASSEQVQAALLEHCYLLIINTAHQCVLGGQRTALQRMLQSLACTPHWLSGVSIAHCEVVKEVAQEYRALHYFPSTEQPQGIVFYSDVSAKPLQITADTAADSRLEHALYTLNYPATIERAYADGVRTFIEIGPGRSCSHMIQQILGDRSHVSRAVCYTGESSCSTLLRTFANLFCLGHTLQLHWLYAKPQTLNTEKKLFFTVSCGAFHKAQVQSHQATTFVATPSIEPRPDMMHEKKNDPPQSTDLSPPETQVQLVPELIAQHLASLQRIEVSNVLAHQSFLSCSQNITGNLLAHAQAQLHLLQSPEFPQEAENNILNRAQCLAFAVGSIATVFGDSFSKVDRYPVRVRLPDEPLMLVDEVLCLEAKAHSMGHGRIVTQHHVGKRPWYLDQGHIPVCIAVEAGQADLILAAYLGIDFIAKGQAVYRLLDATVVFHADLPVQGQIITYDIHVDSFFEHEGTWFMRFHFEGSVDGQPLISMRDGCAGFFSQQALDAGEGIKLNQWEKKQLPGKVPDDWHHWAEMKSEAYDDTQLAQLRAANFSLFGAAFANRVQQPLTLPTGRMNLVHRVCSIEPTGGRFALGRIVAEADIAADDWFLRCHFVDDKVMPGTLMYECCNHTLRVFLMRMGWISEADTSWWGPVQGIQTRLKCRGQVLDSTKVVTYEIIIQEMGYHPEPYAIAEANMYADGKFIVRFDQMSIQLNGSSYATLQHLWQNHQHQEQKPALYDKARIVAFSEGLPSVAFGQPYEIFDQQRKIARLPRDPYAFLDRITAVQGEPWLMQAGASAQAQYDIPVDAWYFSQNRQAAMPFAILLEIALQPCGWLAGYVGSALSSEVDLRFRNLGGKATQYLAVTANSGTLTIDVSLTRVSNSAGMIIQSYQMAVRCAAGLVYEGVTDFGFFSQQALDQQVGVTGASLHEVESMPLQAYPTEAPYPDRQMRMQDFISFFQTRGGPAGLGLIRGYKKVNANEWFFKAHFYQDPVNPGSLGLEAMVQLLKVFAVKRWQGDADMQFQTLALDEAHEWIYRGQVVPSNQEVTVETWITEVDDSRQLLWADGFLQVDGKVIYQMKHFSLQVV